MTDEKHVNLVMVRVDRNIWFAVNSFSSLAAAVSNPREVSFRYSSMLLLVSSRLCQGLRAAPGQANGCPSLACWVILVLYLGFLCDDGEIYTWKGLISKYHHQFILWQQHIIYELQKNKPRYLQWEWPPLFGTLGCRIWNALFKFDIWSIHW